MDYVKIERLIYDESDYYDICSKEVNEIRDIFKAFGIEIKPLF